MRSIRSLFVLLVILVLVITTVILTAVNYTKTESVIVRGVEQNLLDTTRVAANEVSFWLQLRKAEMEAIANSPTLRSGDRQAINAYLAAENKRLPVYSVFWVSDPQGSWYSPAGTAGSISERAYYKELVAKGQSVVSDPLIGKADGKMAVVIAVPIKNNGQLVGILGGNVKMDELIGVVAAIKIGQTGFATCYQSDGFVIADKNADKILKYNPLQDKDSSLHSVMQKIQGGETGVQAVRDNGREVYVAYAPLQGVSWAIASTAYLSEFKGPLVAIGLWSAGAAALLVLLATGVVVLFARRITGPLHKLQVVAEQLAQGDCTAAIDIRARNEIGSLADAFRTMAGNIQNLIGHIKESARQVTVSSGQLTDSAEQSAQASGQVAAVIGEVARGAETQVDAVGKANGVVGELSANIEKVTASARNVAGAAHRTAAAARDGGEAVGTAVGQMQKIETTVADAAAVVAKLGERSGEIGQIVDAIVGLAGQTNLLALNAAVEAARAGEQGRGFAVVAEEVRKLAEQSQEAAKQIAGLIGEIQGDTDKAVQSMAVGTREVSRGTEVVNSAGQAFQEIVRLIEQVTGQVEGISAAVEQMASGSRHLVAAVGDIDAISRETAGRAETVSAATEQQSASMEEISASSQELAKMAAALQAAVDKFRV